MRITVGGDILVRRDLPVKILGVLGLGILVIALACGDDTSSNPSSDNCDPAYPSVCIPSPPPDLDCGEISYRRFQVLAPDPHGFNGDGDGVGCERG